MPRFYPTVELAPGADLTAQPSTWSWTDLTLGRYVHDPARISITRGRQDRYAQTAPAQCSLTLLNPDGIWVPDNPLGTYYGLIDQNTPLRVLIRSNTNSASDTFNRSASSSWGSADVGGTWTNTGGAASDFSVAAASGGRHLHTSATSPHYSTLAFSMIRSDVTVRVKVNALSTGAAQTAGITSRYVDSSNLWRAELQFGTSGAITARLVIRASGTDTPFSSTATGLTHSTSTWYRMRFQTGLGTGRFKVWLDGTTEPATWLIDGTAGAFGNGYPAGAVGLYSIRETSNTNLNATIDFDDFSMVDGVVPRFTGFVDSWPTTWADQSERQALAPITASGRSRIVGQAQNLKSAMFRVHTQGQWSDTLNPVGYWPMEDASSATSFASGLTGGPIMSFSDFRPAADSDIPGSDPLPIGGGAAVFQVTVPTYAASDEWSVRASMRFPALPSANTGVLAWATGGTIDKWVLVLTTGSTWTVQGYTNGTEVLGASFQNFIDTAGGSLLDRPIYLEASANASGGNIAYSFYLWSDGDTTSALGVTGSVAGTMGNITKFFHSAYPGFTSGGYTIGHIGCSGSIGWASNVAKIVRGFATETAGDRFTRLCDEENIPAYFGEIAGAGPGSTNQLMGAQRTTSLIQQLREVEATEEGILFDGMQGQVTLLPRLQRQNHSVDLTLDHDQFQLGWPFTPIRDDFLLRNDITASNVGGSTVHASDVVGIRRWGVYSDSIAVNVADDDEVAQHANWRLNAGQTPQTRYPAIIVNLHDSRAATLIDSWLACDIGSRVQLSNLTFAYDTADLLLEGYTETFDSSLWEIQLNTSPAQPWSVFTLEDTNLGRLDTTGSSLLCGYDSSATSLLVATADNKAQWSTTAEPYYWAVAGEKITVTTMNTNAAAFVAAGTATHADNASLTPSLPSGLQHGDLALAFTAIRNTAATITTPTGWTALLSDGNVALFGRIINGFNETFESGVTGWTATGGSVAQSASQAHSGTKSALLTVSGSPSQAFIRYERSVTPGQAYHLSLWVYSAAGYSDVSPAIDWYDAGHGFLSTSNPGGTSLGAAAWANRSHTATAPSGAAYAQFGPTVGSNPPNGTAVFVDDVVFDLAATLTYSGGSAGDTTSAQTAGFRYTQNVVAYSASSSNASAQNVAVPAMLPPQHNCVALWLGWKQDDWTSVATFAGTEIGEPSTTTGSDQGLVWDYQIQATATETAAGSFTVTGGANAISKGYVVMLAGDVQSCTVTRSVNGVARSQAAGAAVSLWKPGVWAL